MPFNNETAHITIYTLHLKIISLLLVIISFHTIGQDITVKIKDFNNDGIPDTLKSFYDGGSGFGGWFYEIINGKTKEIYSFDTFGCFCEIKRCIIIPKELQKDENSKFLEAINKECFSNIKETPDPSLQWIINSNLSHKVLRDTTRFDLLITPDSSWNKGKIQLPGWYCIAVEGETLYKLYSSHSKIPDWFNRNENYKGYLCYGGHNHYRNPSNDSLLLCDFNINYKVYRTSHGILIKNRDDLYKWIFVSDVHLTGAPDKLRWESIEKVILIDNYVVIHQCLPLSDIIQVFVVNIESSVCGRLKFKFQKKVFFEPEKFVKWFKELEALY